MSQPESDPNETVELSGADFAMMKEEMNALAHFFQLFKSYNPDLPMDAGMKAEFLARRNRVELFR